MRQWVNIAQWLAYLLLHPDAPGLIPSIPEIISGEKFVHVAEVIERHYLEES